MKFNRKLFNQKRPQRRVSSSRASVPPRLTLRVSFPATTTPAPPRILIPKICLKLLHHPVLLKIAQLKGLCPHLPYYELPNQSVALPNQSVFLPANVVAKGSTTRKPPEKYVTFVTKLYPAKLSGSRISYVPEVTSPSPPDSGFYHEDDFDLSPALQMLLSRVSTEANPPTRRISLNYFPGGTLAPPSTTPKAAEHHNQPVKAPPVSSKLDFVSLIKRLL
jgi:hypothetical protein